MDVSDAVYEVAREVAGSLEVELLEARWLGSGSARSFRIVVDRPDGVSADVCAALTRQFDVVWEARSAERRDFGLEVTSPGPNRALVTERDFRRIAGRWIEVTYREAGREVGSENRATTTGKVLSCADGVLSLACAGEDDSDEVVQIELSAIQRAKVLYIIGDPRPKKKRKKKRKNTS